jgi:hypothetical protein
MDENPYKAPVEKDPTPMAREPQNETFWTVTFCIGAFFWMISSGAIFTFTIGMYDPRTCDGFSPNEFEVWCAMIAAEWILGAAATIAASLKLPRRPPA